MAVDEVVGAAVAETGLDDLGDPACCEGLAVLRSDLEHVLVRGGTLTA